MDLHSLFLKVKKKVGNKPVKSSTWNISKNSFLCCFSLYVILYCTFKCTWKFKYFFLNLIFVKRWSQKSLSDEIMSSCIIKRMKSLNFQSWKNTVTKYYIKNVCGSLTNCFMIFCFIYAIFTFPVSNFLFDPNHFWKFYYDFLEDRQTASQSNKNNNALLTYQQDMFELHPAMKTKS